MSNPVLGADRELSPTVLGRHPGRGDRFDKSDEDGIAEDSDYEEDPDPAGDPASENTETDHEEERRLFSVFSVGSPIA